MPTTDEQKTTLSSNVKTPAKPRPARLSAALPTANAGSTVPLPVAMRIDQTPTNFESLPNYSLFTLAADGSTPLLLKIAKSKYCNLRTGRSDWAGTGRCYEIYL